MYVNAGHWEELHSPSKLSSTSKLEDVWDGSVLRPMCGPGRYFSNDHNLALALSTDGVALYKSSLVSIWPVYLVVLNLPAHVRMNAENVLLCGVWVGPEKPLMNLLLDPVCDYLKQLSTRGIPIKTSHGEFIFRGKLVWVFLTYQPKQLSFVQSNSMVNMGAQCACILEKGYPTMPGCTCLVLSMMNEHMLNFWSLVRRQKILINVFKGY